MNNKPRSDRPRLRKRWTMDFWIFLAGTVLVIYFRPFALLFHDLGAYEGIHRGAWPEVAIFATAWAVMKTIYLWGFRREEQHRELDLIKDDIRRGRMQRMSFAARWLLILCMLGLISLGWHGSGPARTHLLMLAVPLFLLFIATELNIVIHPGESVIPDSRDELLMFFKARMLQAGYITAIVAFVALYLVYLLAPGYLGLLLPIGLALCLFVPGLVYRHLDHRATTGG